MILLHFLTHLGSNLKPRNQQGTVGQIFLLLQGTRLIFVLLFAFILYFFEVCILLENQPGFLQKQKVFISGIFQIPTNPYASDRPSSC